ncbi:hypothetical protein E2C01_096898 [Portunus trituberculatus]|uniref:Uncharacterized protein n=1 Tax=Portunus trituberculatus TaxID=210409 RepID=A0A5B7K9P8_PORTR|nr:hypothetical protein [Portunus trituberculatus]
MELPSKRCSLTTSQKNRSTRPPSRNRWIIYGSEHSGVREDDLRIT